MDSIYLIIVVLMFVLAIADLIVGVSNDAVNFLNSAMGSKAGSFRQIMIVASVGIIFGAVFSSGMMEVARRGIFNPEYFTMEEIMFLFVAVMLTDIILLDFFNSIALPTSTTVSIVFELLGAAIAISFFSVIDHDHSIGEWKNYINGSRALVIIVGIFLSIVIAFFLGWAIQYTTRLFVSFEYKKSMRSFGSVFGALSVSLILMFILQKGLQGIPFISTDALITIRGKSLIIAVSGFILAFIAFQIFIGKKGFNVYRFITYLGTFALAMAFASNDLVNFIGVPIASFDSYISWSKTDIPANDYMMTALLEPIKTNPFFLLLAGIIMTFTLWYSKKARSVIQTSVNLGRQDEGSERFSANEISRRLVKSVMSMSEIINRIIPTAILEQINKRFNDPDNHHYNDPETKPAFDLVRASVNLMAAAGIILLATSLKLPLSTTFVTFMVLMGSSLADRAWAQGSAVYRISGVFIVIGGWFLTAAVALTVSIIFASLLISFKIYALVGLVLLALFMIFRNMIFYRHHRLKTEMNLNLADKWFKTDFYEIESEIRKNLIHILNRSDTIYKASIDALIENNRKILGQLSVNLLDIESTNDQYKVKLTQQIKDVPQAFRSGGRLLMYIYDMEDELLYGLGNIIRTCNRHVSNLHPKLTKEQIKILRQNEEGLKIFMDQILVCLNKYVITDKDYQRFKKARKTLVNQIEKGFSDQIDLASSKRISGKNSELMLTILIANKNMVATNSRLIKLFYKIKLADYSDNLLDELLTE